jgi:hypothetical protein
LGGILGCGCHPLYERIPRSNFLWLRYSIFLEFFLEILSILCYCFTSVSLFVFVITWALFINSVQKHAKKNKLFRCSHSCQPMGWHLGLRVPPAFWT